MSIDLERYNTIFPHKNHYSDKETNYQTTTKKVLFTPIRKGYK